MRVRELTVPDAFEIVPVQHSDERGLFLEWFAQSLFERETGHCLSLAQANCSVSSQGVVRGVHFADVPPGQAKYVTCASGAVLDVVVDLRLGSPAYGTWDAVRLDDVDRKAVFIAEGLGHAFMALSEQAALMYLCSEQYNPQREHGIDPFDVDLAIDWPGSQRGQTSARDASAPGLRELEAGGALPDWQACQDLYRAR